MDSPEQPRIARRHAHSIALAAYFRHRAELHDESGRPPGPSFSQQRRTGHQRPTVWRTSLSPIPADVDHALRTALPDSVHAEVGIHDGSWVGRLIELLESTENELTGDVSDIEKWIDETVKERKFGLAKRLEDTKRTITGRELLGFLANRNILPKYGFPVDTVELNTLNAVDAVGRKLELDRDLSLAIYDYAPGNQVVAGGKLWTSDGLRKRPGRSSCAMLIAPAPRADDSSKAPISTPTLSAPAVA